MRVAPVTPPYHARVVGSAGAWLHLGSVYVAGVLRESGHELVTYEAMSKGHALTQIRARLRPMRPDIVGASAKKTSLYAAIDVLPAPKEELPGVVTVIGGVHPTLRHEIPAGFRREYLLGSMEAMLRLSFLKKYGQGLGKVPAAASRYLKGLPVGKDA